MDRDVICHIVGYNQAIEDAIEIIQKNNSKSEIIKQINSLKKSIQPEQKIEPYQATITKYFNKQLNLGYMIIEEPQKKYAILLELDSGTYSDEKVDLEYAKNNFPQAENLIFDNKNHFNITLEEILKNFKKTTS